MLMHVADAITAAAVLAGLWAAFLWWRSARIPVDPGPGVGSGLQDVQDRAWTIALLVAAMDGSRLNSRAAQWTAVSVAAQAIATVLDRLATP